MRVTHNILLTYKYFNTNICFVMGTNGHATEPKNGECIDGEWEEGLD